ncbi:MAG: hypothetical protein Q9212_003925 [Teloschistes hypoglaucus]
MTREFDKQQRLRPFMSHPITLHIILLSVIAADWKDYVAYLRETLDDTEAEANRNDLLLELGERSIRLKTYRKAVENIMIRSQGTLDLMSFDPFDKSASFLSADALFKLFKILEYRSEEVRCKTATALYKDIESLRDIAHYTRRENEAQVRLAE